MKRILIALMLGLLCLNFSSAQFKSEEQNHPSVVNSFVKPTTGLSGVMSWFDPANFQMHHSFSLQYLASGDYGLSLATYTNSMMYKIADPLDVRFDVSLQGSPFGSDHQTTLNKLFLSRAELNYRPWENVHIQFLLRQYPFDSYSRYYGYPSSMRYLGDE